MQNIISLTSFPARINEIHLVIKSLLNQSVSPDRVVLYLVEGEFADKTLPDSLTELLKDTRFEIRWRPENLKSFNKLIWALQEFPDANIITVDDDIVYPRKLLRTLLRTQRKYPGTICAHRVRFINIQDKKIQPYKTWKLSEKRKLFGPRYEPGFLNFLCGVGGVLYPPHSLHNDVFMMDRFTKLCRHQDDVWFWAMAVKNNVKISVTPFGYNVARRTIGAVQSVGLYTTINSGATSPNNIAVDNVLKCYPDIAEKLGVK